METTIEHASAVPQPHPGSALEVFGVATRLGLTSFGGPIAHLGYFDDFDMLVVIGAVERGVHDLGAKVQLGAGLAAAQHSFAGGR